MLGLLGAISLVTAARNWTSVWRGLDSLTMTVDGIEMAEDQLSIDVVMTFTNGSDRQVRIHEIGSSTRLAGRNISGGSERFDDVVLLPGDQSTVRVRTVVSRYDVGFLEAGMKKSDATWHVSGRVQVSVEQLDEAQWFPYRARVRVE